ncbi:MAG: alkaline phosphatase family protein [Steroidobacteraceae bacterium]
MKSSSRLLMIGLDAAELTLVRAWIAEGHLPVMGRLLARGSLTTLTSTAHWLVGAPWPCFYTSRPPESVGMYHYLVWRPELMNAQRPAPDWLPLEPFWRELPRAGCDVIALDIPLCYAPGEYGGVEVSGWATHELLQGPGSTPPALLEEVRREFGVAPFDDEASHQLSAAECLEVRDQCVETARRVGELAARLLERHPWRLGMIAFSSTHRGGHMLWDRSILKGSATAAQLAEFDVALRGVYAACDSALGRILGAHEDAAVMVYALHGMGANNDCTSLLSTLLTRVLAARPVDADTRIHARGLAARLRVMVPDEWRARVKKRLPQRLQDWLTLYWRTSPHAQDWSRTQAFVVFCDLDGYIRINLQGREREGVVSPADYPALCERVAAGLRSFRDADTGEPLVREIGFAHALFNDEPRRRHLPDLIVKWHEVAAHTHRRVVSDEFGALDWPTPGRHPLGRSGSHHREGFLIAAGPGLEAGELAIHGTTLDLAPTALDVLGMPIPEQFCGHSLRRAETPVA